MSKVGSYGSGRYLASFYPLAVIPFLCWRGMDLAVRHRGWQKASFCLVISTLGLVILSRERPLWPANFCSERLVHWQPGNKFFQEIFNSYNFTRQARSRINPFADHLPASSATIGYAARYGGLRELVCWEPLGKAKVYRVTPDDNAQTLARNQVGFLAVQEDFLSMPGVAEKPWLKNLNARKLGDIHYRILPDSAEENLTLWQISNSSQEGEAAKMARAWIPPEATGNGK